MHLIDGKSLAETIVARVRGETDALHRTSGRRPGLAVVLVGDDPASEIYIGRKVAAAKRAGIESITHRLSAATTFAELGGLIDVLNADPEVNGILIQLPLPRHIDAMAVLGRIDPGKDVDGFHPVNVGRLSIGTTGLVPCTPLGCMRLLETVIDDFRGMKAVVIGKSNIVGKPVALLLLERECTVTVTHLATQALADIVRSADIVVVAAGSPGLVRGYWVKPGAVVVDVGINRARSADGSSRIVGDAVTHELGHAAAVTPVPGGVGPMTVACLMENTLRAASAVWNAPVTAA